jgi:hypothetical protein
MAQGLSRRYPDMVLGLSRDGGKSFETPARVADDGWKITACPHRGGQVAMDGNGKVYAAWYTEGKQGVPRMLLATSADGRRFGAPLRINSSTATIPDQIRLAVNAAGQVVVVWRTPPPCGGASCFAPASTAAGPWPGADALHGGEGVFPRRGDDADRGLRGGLARGAVPLAQDRGPDPAGLPPAGFPMT